MKNLSPSRRPLLAPLRAVAGCCGIVLGCGISSGVVVLFGNASQSAWLAPTPANLAAAERCERGAERNARDACMQRAVTVAKAARLGTTVAQGAAPTADGGKAQ